MNGVAVNPIEEEMQPLTASDRLQQRPERRRLDKFFKALSDETRREILRLLEQEDLTVGEIVDQFHLSQPTISRHLAVLKEAELVSDQRMGQRVLYRLRDGALARRVQLFFSDFSQCRPAVSILPTQRDSSPRPVPPLHARS